jgi:hypothetical protein
MKTSLSLGSIAFALLLASCSQQGEVEQREQLASCDDGRPSTFNVARDLYGATQAVAEGNDGFLLFNNNTAGKGVVRVDQQGVVVQRLANPIDAEHWVGDISPQGDGGAILSGSVGQRPPRQGWVAKTDSAWNVLWEVPLGPEGFHSTVHALADGGALVAGAAVGEREATAFLGRIDPAGQLLWERRLPFSPPVSWGNTWWTTRDTAVDAEGRVRSVLASAEGLLLISSDLDGNVEQQLLETELALRPKGVAALPDGRLALLSERQGAILTMLDARGQVLWEKTYGRERGVEPFGIAFNAARNELLLSGSSRGRELTAQRTWLLAADDQGDELWSLERKPLDRVGADGNVVDVAAGQGPPVIGLAVAPDGTVLGAGYTGFELSYFVLGEGECP